MNCSAGEHEDCNCEQHDNDIRALQEQIERLRESLAIFLHAHATGNNVPPHLEEQARSLVEGGAA